MQVSLKESELNVAVRQYLANQGINLTNKDVSIDFSATRGADGIKATIDIVDSDMPSLTPNVRPNLAVVVDRQLPSPDPSAKAVASVMQLSTETPLSPFVAQGSDDSGDTGAADSSPVDGTKKVSLFGG